MVDFRALELCVCVCVCGWIGNGYIDRFNWFLACSQKEFEGNSKCSCLWPSCSSTNKKLFYPTTNKIIQAFRLKKKQKWAPLKHLGIVCSCAVSPLPLYLTPFSGTYSLSVYWVKLSTFNVIEFIETHEIMCCVNNDNVFPCCEVLVGLFLTNLNMVKLKLAYLCKTERLLLWNGILRMTQQVTPQTLYNLKCKDCKKCCIFTLAET